MDIWGVGGGTQSYPPLCYFFLGLFIFLLYVYFL